MLVRRKSFSSRISNSNTKSSSTISRPSHNTIISSSSIIPANTNNSSSNSIWTTIVLTITIMWSFRHRYHLQPRCLRVASTRRSSTTISSSSRPSSNIPIVIMTVNLRAVAAITIPLRCRQTTASPCHRHLRSLVVPKGPSQLWVAPILVCVLFRFKRLFELITYHRNLIFRLKLWLFIGTSKII